MPSGQIELSNKYYGVLRTLLYTIYNGKTPAAKEYGLSIQLCGGDSRISVVLVLGFLGKWTVFLTEYVARCASKWGPQGNFGKRGPEVDGFMS